VENVERQSFLSKVRASPRRRRRLAWLGSCAAVLAVLLAVALILPNTRGEKPGPADPQPDGGTFWLVATILFAAFLLMFLYAVIRALWRIHTGDAEESAGSDGYTWRNSRRDLERAIRSGD
jgi:TRAP-type C4-dicarboxylate transport system permease small subunit